MEKDLKDGTQKMSPHDKNESQQVIIKITEAEDDDNAQRKGKWPRG